ncbi:MAG: hypothetical protein RL318_3152, partial [Fibrobacterota bacterium]
PVPVWLVVHDAHRFPRRLRQARITVRAGGQLHQAEVSFDQALDAPFHFISLPWPGPEIAGENLLDVVFQVEDAKGRRETFRNHSLPGLPDGSLKILRLASGFPFPRGWVSGDLHCHTHWSQDPVEFGADPLVMRAAAKALGMDFFAATDHSYDFAWESPNFMVPTDPVKNFSRYRQSLPIDQIGEPVVLPAEEVSCGNHLGQNVHLLVIDHPEYIPGQGDGGRRWLDNRPDLSLGRVLERTLASGAPAFAAHPVPGIAWLQRKLFRRGDYHAKDMLPGLTGLQFWNGHTGRDFEQGMNLWLKEALAGRILRPVAGNDAHGDLNRATHVRVPLLRLGMTQKHRFGHARTWLQLGEGVGVERASLRQALKTAPTLLSDGPYLWIDLHGSLSARSLPEFGTWTEIVVWVMRDGREEILLREEAATLELHRRLDLPAGTRWIRAQGKTNRGRTALTQIQIPG